MDFTNNHILIIGLGISNLSIIKYLAKYPIQGITVTDLQPYEKLSTLAEEAKSAFPNIELILGSHENIEIEKFDLVIKSPSISDETPFLQKVIKLGIPVETDLSLFFKIISPTKIIGITGTKGKSTTSTLIYTAIKSQGYSVILCGNMGIPVFDTILEASNAEWVVIEISSFMAVSLFQNGVSPHIGVITNVSQDHIDFHGTYEQYVMDKINLFKNQKDKDITFVSKDCSELVDYANKHINFKQFYSYTDLPENIETKLRGIHYKSNIAAAYQVAKYISKESFNLSKFKEAIKNFDPLESRMESRATIEGVEYINNSKATNTGAFCADLSTLIQENKDIYVICGGADKGLDLSEMASLLNCDRVQKIALINAEGSWRLKPMIDANKILDLFDSVTDAFSRIQDELEHTNNEVVILMPGTSTYGIFKNKVGSNDFNQNIINLI